MKTIKQRYGVVIPLLLLTKKGREILSKHENFERMSITECFNEQDHENLKEIAIQIPHPINSVANIYVLHKKNKEDTLKAIKYSMGIYE